jgi:hypothetical protein
VRGPAAPTNHRADHRDRPWTLAFAMTRTTDPRYEFLEEACHEGNEYTVSGQLRVGLKPFPGVVARP